MAKIRAVIVEGEMTPAELKEYVDAFWRGDTTMTRVAAQADLVPEQPVKASAPVQVPVAEVVQSEPVPVVVEADGRREQLLKTKKMSDLLALLMEDGKSTLPEMLEACRELQAEHPGLAKLGDGLEDRITRTFEGMR